MPDRPILEIMHAVLSIHPDASVEEAVQKMSSQGMEAILIKQERSEEHTSELQSRRTLVCRLLLEKKKKHYINCQR